MNNLVRRFSEEELKKLNQMYFGRKIYYHKEDRMCTIDTILYTPLPTTRGVNKLIIYAADETGGITVVGTEEVSLVRLNYDSRYTIPQSAHHNAAPDTAMIFDANHTRPTRCQIHRAGTYLHLRRWGL